ncbi:hypothetical protein SV7mr_49370 [Stieleria bergensis]|uniref:Uncharacterized protein n=1 Tax=Stieleria bergensis TaxID=2528025 RepID=A0A517T1Y9_9BACT|nr:hypothetical protein SV7mr_49370 [Planctomycetes bacterium SV_7m_r]
MNDESNNQIDDDDDLPPMPDDVADAWAAVLIDVHEKRKHNVTTKASDTEKESFSSERE